MTTGSFVEMLQACRLLDGKLSLNDVVRTLQAVQGDDALEALLSSEAAAEDDARSLAGSQAASVGRRDSDASATSSAAGSAAHRRGSNASAVHTTFTPADFAKTHTTPLSFSRTLQVQPHLPADTHLLCV